MALRGSAEPEGVVRSPGSLSGYCASGSIEVVRGDDRKRAHTGLAARGLQPPGGSREYLDTAEGVVSVLPEGRCWVSEVILKPRITFNSQQQVAASATAHFHELAQYDCFIVQSIKTKVTVRISPVGPARRLVVCTTRRAMAHRSAADHRPESRTRRSAVCTAAHLRSRHRCVRSRTVDDEKVS